MSISEQLALNARIAPHTDAYVFRSHNGTEERLSWGEMWERVQRLARGLACSVLTGERVMIIFDPGLAFIETFFAVQMAGAVPVPMSGRFGTRSAERVRGAIASGIVTNIISDVACSDFVRQFHDTNSNVRIFGHEDLYAIGEADRALPGTAQDAFVQFSSGSTGAPHGIFIDHSNLQRNLGLMAKLCAAQPGDVSVSWLPAHHDFGLIGGILFPAFIQGTGILMAPSSFVRRPRTWLELITRYKATFTGAPNFGYELAAKRVSDVTGLDLRSLRTAINGAERVQADTLRRFELRFAPAGLRADTLRPCYGLAEATLLVSGAADVAWESRFFRRDRLQRNLLVASESHGECDGDIVELVSNGLPVVDHLAIVADDVGVGPGEVGEIMIADASVSRSSRARTVSCNGSQGVWVSTGDLGALINGQLFVVGRMKDLVIRDGVNIHLEEIDNLIDELVLPGRLQEICSFRVADTEDVGVIVEETRHAQLTTEIVDDIRNAVMRHFNIRLADVLILSTGSIPRTTSGKKQRFACSDLVRSRRDAAHHLGIC